MKLKKDKDLKNINKTRITGILGVFTAVDIKVDIVEALLAVADSGSISDIKQLRLLITDEDNPLTNKEILDNKATVYAGDEELGSDEADYEIDPIVVDIETVLERPVSQTILANSISLTPGTLSVDLDSENNIIKVAAISPREKEDIIPFEPYIKKMLE